MTSSPFRVKFWHQMRQLCDDAKVIFWEQWQDAVVRYGQNLVSGPWVKYVFSIWPKSCIISPISASCRRPIRGAAGRPVKPSEYWLDESRVQHSVRTESHAYSESFSRPHITSSKAPVRRGFLSVLLKLLLLVVVCGSLYYVYQNLDSDQINTLKGSLDTVIVPLQGAVEKAATYLGISSTSAVDSTGN